MKQNIRELLIREEKARKQIISPFLSSLGLTPGQGQARILSHLSQKDHITQKTLADICKLDAATMSRNIDKLENMGFLNRETNPDCRRSFLICLTEKGRVEAAKIDKVFQQFDSMICNNISDANLEVFCNVLNIICDNLDAHKNGYEQ
jgi:DNA-binding MarR family transcriptional regulator